MSLWVRRKDDKSTVEATGHLHSSNKILNRMRDEGTGELGPQQHETR